MRTLILFGLLFICSSIVRAQQLDLTLRAPLQFESQREEITYGPHEIQKSTAFNFGMDALLGIHLSQKVKVGLGLGYFRDRFAISRPYNHELLNLGFDSIPDILKTRTYDYNLLRTPISIKYTISKNSTNSFSLGFEYIPAFSFSSSYNGAVPYPGAKTTAHGFKFFSHSLNLSATISFQLKNSTTIGIEPYCSVLHIYRNDRILYTDESQFENRSFDAFGIGFFFTLNL